MCVCPGPDLSGNGLKVHAVVLWATCEPPDHQKTLVIVSIENGGYYALFFKHSVPTKRCNSNLVAHHHYDNNMGGRTICIRVISCAFQKMKPCYILSRPTQRADYISPVMMCLIKIRSSSQFIRTQKTPTHLLLDQNTSGGFGRAAPSHPLIQSSIACYTINNMQERFACFAPTNVFCNDLCGCICAGCGCDMGCHGYIWHAPIWMICWQRFTHKNI